MKASIYNIIRRLTGHDADYGRKSEFAMRNESDGQHGGALGLDCLKLACIAADWSVHMDRQGKVCQQVANSDADSEFGLPVMRGGNARTLLDLVHVQDRVSYLSAFSSCIERNKREIVEVRMNVQQSGASSSAVRLQELVFAPVKDEKTASGEVGVIVIGKDINDHSAESETLRKERDEREQADIAKTRFLANMSHELRTPLNAIVGFSQILQSDLMEKMKEDKRQEYVGIINESALHLLSVLNDILDMSKIEAGRYEIFPEPFDLAAVMKSAISMLEVNASGNDVALGFDIAGDLPEVTGDCRAIKQVLINLISNAIKFSKSGSSVNVSAKRVGRNVKLTIEDQGIGISEDNIAKLGQPFYQADAENNRKFEGTGLGLSVVFGLVKLHGGKVKIESTLGVGTTVCVTLPIICSAAAPVPADCDAQIIRLETGGTESETQYNLYGKTA